MKNIWKWVTVIIALGFVGVWFFPAFAQSLGINANLMGQVDNALRTQAGTGANAAGGSVAGGMVFTLLFIALAVWGGITYVRKTNRTQKDLTSPTEACPQCGKPLLAGWTICPNCGKFISR
jgi:ribosomal protein L32